jgi:hypothetical protein
MSQKEPGVEREPPRGNSAPTVVGQRPGIPVGKAVEHDDAMPAANCRGGERAPGHGGNEKGLRLGRHT